MKESVKKFCSLNGLGEVTAEMLYDAYIGSEANDDSRDKKQPDDAGGEVQACRLRCRLRIRTLQNATEPISVYGRLRQANILNLGKEKVPRISRFD